MSPKRTLAGRLLAGLLPASLALAAPSLPELAADPAWSGPPPLSGLPSADEVRAAHAACAAGKERAAAAALTRDAARTEDPREDYDALYYALALEMRQGDEALAGEVLVRLRSLVDGLGTLVLDAAENLDVQSVTVVGVPLAFVHEDGTLAVTLDEPLDEGDVAEIVVGYAAEFTGGGVLSVWRTNVQTGQSIHTLTTQSEPFDARRWWPCKDDTRDKADSLRIAVTTDDFNAVVCNGVLESDIDHGDGTRTATWFERWPIVTYLASVCVTEYNHAETVWNYGDVSLPMHDWSWSLSAADQQNVMQAGLFALTAHSDHYGLYPFHDEKYGHAQYTWGGAMEHQSCSSMGFYNEAVIAHELSHQWFGDKVTCDTFHHIWLNEGWATYSEALYYEYYLGEEMLHEYMSYEQYWGPGTIFVEDPWTDNIFDGNLSYAKGSWVVHMLRHVMGDEAFWAAVRAYLGPNERAYHRTATTDEFREFMEAEHGADLSWFFDEWILGEYWPDYGYAWSQETVEGETTLTAQVVQRQAPGRQTFAMPVDLRGHYDGGTHDDVVLFVDQAAQSFHVTLPAEATADELDPDEWILREVEELAAPPATNLVLAPPRLEDGEGGALETIPAGGAFRIVATVSNAGADAEALEAELTVDLPGVTLDEPLQTLDALPFGESVTLAWTGSGAADLSGMAAFELELRWEGGEQAAGFAFPAGRPELLLVDDDGGDGYESWYEEALAGRVHYERVEADDLPGDLDGYALVLWFSGDAANPLTAPEWSAVHDYVDGAAGHVVFTGRHFAQAQDPTLLLENTGVEVLDPDYESNAVFGEGLFAGERWYLFGGGAGNQTQMDALTGLLDCMSPVGDSNGQTEGSAGEELWCGDGGVIVLGFGLEGAAPIGNGLHLDATLERLLAWARGETAVEPGPEPLRPAGLRVTGAWPNPFNPATRIAWESPAAGRLRLAVVNLAGQLVAERSLECAAGAGALDFDASRLASGLYVARLELAGLDGRRLGGDSVKLLLLR